MPNIRQFNSSASDEIADAEILFARLQAKGAYLAAAQGRWLLTVPQPGRDAVRPKVSLAAVDQLRARGLLMAHPGGGWRLKRRQPDDASPAADRRPRPTDEQLAVATSPIVNEAESPLGWLRSRKGKNGRPLVSREQFLAGERLRADHERAALSSRVTANWEMPASRGQGGPAPLTLTDGAIAARQRFHKALDAVGEELAEILVQVCCLSAGIEQAERLLALPQRSGRVVLGLGLTALARHYGFIAGKRRTAAPGHWAMPGYRPAIAPGAAE